MKPKTETTPPATPPEVTALLDQLRGEHEAAAAALAEFNQSEARRKEAIAKLKSEIADCEFQATALLDSDGNPSEIGMRRAKLLNTVPILQRRLELREKPSADDLERLRLPQKPFFRVYLRLSATLLQTVRNDPKPQLINRGLYGSVASVDKAAGPALAAKIEILPSTDRDQIDEIFDLDCQPATATMTAPDADQIAFDLALIESKMPALIAAIEQRAESFAEALAEVDKEQGDKATAADFRRMREHRAAIAADHRARLEKTKAKLQPGEEIRIPVPRFL